MVNVRKIFEAHLKLDKDLKVHATFRVNIERRDMLKKEAAQTHRLKKSNVKNGDWNVKGTKIVPILLRLKTLASILVCSAGKKLGRKASLNMRSSIINIYFSLTQTIRLIMVIATLMSLFVLDRAVATTTKAQKI